MNDLIAAIPLFADLPDEARQSLSELMVRHTARRGTVLFGEGEPGDNVHVVLSGKVKIVRTAGDGRENLLAVLGPGDLFGELSLIDPGPRTAAAIALSDLEEATLAHSAIKPWLRERPEVSELLLRVLARRLRNTNDAMADLVFTDVPGRVAKQLLELARRFGRVKGDGTEVEHGLTQEELAQLVGASRETVNKALSDFAARGWIQLESRRLVIVDPERLARRAR